MAIKKMLFAFVTALTSLTLVAQPTTVWNGKKCAVVLTYDDALHVHLDKVIPALDSLNLKATFYLTASSKAFTDRLAQWKTAAKHGHELANHTLFHPCAGNLPGRSFVSADYDLSHYSLRRITDEISMTNSVLEAVDGKTTRTFAFPCGDRKIRDSFYLNASKDAFVAARGVTPELESIDKIDMYNINSFMIHERSGQELIDMVKKAMATNSLLVFLFHGVGGEHSLNVSLEAHNQLLKFLKQQEKEIWIAPLITIADHVRQYQASKASN